jgi:hypothetical protein
VSERERENERKREREKERKREREKERKRESEKESKRERDFSDLPIEYVTLRYSTTVGSEPRISDQAKKLFGDKHSSLYFRSVNDEEIFYNIKSSGLYNKTLARRNQCNVLN